MHELTAMIRADLKPALGVTEPGAVAFCAALAKSHLPGDLIQLDVRMNLELFREGLSSPRTVFTRRLLAMTGTEETIVEIQAEKTL